ncbi:hypothetical protein, unlikely [Trypanosoma brucei brucei TREU927]|uniref:Uncharacterized protein n=1 Tax=Trypanosoma brucei brucei (strain 927/4 GUTat10.1) TaxID=185431 RepID=Q4GY84_TRYB2|nr:hypothetical protein, unlikely [Trypanosoma brucei brucei TREU927]CAJ16702.1 hypothetical protein, unlikely [Trypanosoma brucei brucei TREU927]
MATVSPLPPTASAVSAVVYEGRPFALFLGCATFFFFSVSPSLRGRFQLHLQPVPTGGAFGSIILFSQRLFVFSR